MPIRSTYNTSSHGQQISGWGGLDRSHYQSPHMFDAEEWMKWRKKPLLRTKSNFLTWSHQLTTNVSFPPMAKPVRQRIENAQIRK